MNGNLHIGEAIRRGRREKKLSQKELAKILGVSPSLVSFWENNARGPSGQELIRIAKYLDIVHLLFPDYEIRKKSDGKEEEFVIREEIAQYRNETLELKKKVNELDKKVDKLSIISEPES